MIEMPIRNFESKCLIGNKHKAFGQNNILSWHNDLGVKIKFQVEWFNHESMKFAIETTNRVLKWSFEVIRWIECQIWISIQNKKYDANLKFWVKLSNCKK